MRALAENANAKNQRKIPQSEFKLGTFKISQSSFREKELTSKAQVLRTLKIALE